MSTESDLPGNQTNRNDMNSHLTKRRYSQPPILEAICEIHFAPERQLSREMIEMLMPVWKDGYPEQNVVEEKQVQLHMDMKGMRATEGNRGHKLICRSADQLRLVQLASSFLAVNQLRPYQGWEEGFRDVILARWKNLQEVCPMEQVSRIGLRYINRIEIPQHPLQWEEWFNFPLPLPGNLRHPSGHFHLLFQQPLSEGMRSIINIASAQPAPTGCTWVMLDLDVVLEAPIPAADLPRELERVHGPHSLAFEEYVSDKLRELFEPV